MKPKEQETEGVNKTQPSEELHSQPAWEPSVSAKTPVEEKNERGKMREGRERRRGDGPLSPRRLLQAPLP